LEKLVLVLHNEDRYKAVSSLAQAIFKLKFEVASNLRFEEKLKEWETKHQCSFGANDEEKGRQDLPAKHIVILVQGLDLWVEALIQHARVVKGKSGESRVKAVDDFCMEFYLLTERSFDLKLRKFITEEMIRKGTRNSVTKLCIWFSGPVSVWTMNC